MHKKSNLKRIQGLYEQAECLFGKDERWPPIGPSFFRNPSLSLKQIEKKITSTQDQTNNYYGHTSLNYMRSHSMEALALISAQKRERAINKLCSIGYYFKDADLEGHSYPLWAMLGGYDRSENFPPSEFVYADDKYYERLKHRNLNLRVSVRQNLQARLAIKSHDHFPLDSIDSIDDPTLAELALRQGNFVLARRAFLRMRNVKSSFWASGPDTTVDAILGLARIALRQERYGIAMKYSKDALAITPSLGGALLLKMHCEIETRFVERAKKTYRLFVKYYPLEAGEFEGIKLVNIETKLGIVPRMRGYADAAIKAFEEKRFKNASVFLKKIFGRRKHNLLKGRRRNLAALYLLTLAILEGDLKRQSEIFLEEDPDFLNAREALAYGYVQQNENGKAKKHFESTGLRKFISDQGWEFEDWKNAHPLDALSPISQSAMDRLSYLLNNGLITDALKMLDLLPALSERSELRYLIALGLFTYDDPNVDNAKEAWKWLKSFVLSSKGLSAMVFELAVEILKKGEDWEMVLKVPLDSHVINYPSLSGFAYDRILPRLCEAHQKLGQTRQACEILEDYFCTDRRSFSRLNLLYQDVLKADDRKMLTRAQWEKYGQGTLSQTLKSTTNFEWVKKYLGKNDEEEMFEIVEKQNGAYENNDVKALQWSERAWRYDRAGQYEKAEDAYLHVAELKITIAAIGLANAGNTLTKKKEWESSLAFLKAALFCCNSFPVESRATVLDKVASHFYSRECYATALPSALVAFQFSPTPERAMVIVNMYTMLGNVEASDFYRNIVRSKEPRLVSRLSIEYTDAVGGL